MTQGIGSLVFTEYHGYVGTVNIHLAKTTPNEVGHLLGTGPMYGEYRRGA